MSIFICVKNRSFHVKKHNPATNINSMFSELFLIVEKSVTASLSNSENDFNFRVILA